MNRKPSAHAVTSLLAALLLPLLLSACDRREVEDDTAATPADTEMAQPGETGTAPAPGPDADVEPDVTPMAPEPPDESEAATPGTPAAGTSQADALALLMTIDEHEIAVADQALAKNVTGKVRDYAQMMKTDHGKNLTDTTKLGGAASTAPAVKSLKDKGDNDMRALGEKNGKDYERAYVDAMVKGHTEALSMIDNTLLPAATDANVREHFTTTRATVARHLDEARKLQATP